MIKRMLASLGDPYTRFLTPEEVVHYLPPSSVSLYLDFLVFFVLISFLCMTITLQGLVLGHIVLKERWEEKLRAVLMNVIPYNYNIHVVFTWCLFTNFTAYLIPWHMSLLSC